MSERDRSINAVIARLRFGDSDGDDHDIAVKELERLRSQLTDFHNLDDVGEIKRLRDALHLIAEGTYTEKGAEDWAKFTLRNRSADDMSATTITTEEKT